LGYILFEFNDYERASKYLKKAHSQDIIESNLILGKMFEFGLFEKIDLNKAKEYYRIGMNNKIPNAFTRMGLMKRDMNLIKEASELGDEEAYFILGKNQNNSKKIFNKDEKKISYLNLASDKIYTARIYLC
jgi:TPR repeat protein